MDKNMITTEDLFKMSFKNVPYLKSQEVYFSKITSLETVLFELISDLRTLYNDYFNVDYSVIKSDNKQYAIIIENAIKKYETRIQNAINAESVTIGITLKANASAYPMIWDSRLLKEDIYSTGDNRLQFDNKFAKSLEDIMTSDDGFKFRNPKGKTVVFLIGLGFFKLGITDKEFVALLLHEWGHCLEQMIMNVNAEIYCEYKRGLIEDAVNIIDFISFKDTMLDPGKVVSNFLAIFPRIFTLIFDERRGFKKLEKETGKDPGKTGELLAKKIMGEFDRNEIVKDTKNERFYTINRIVKSRPKKVKESIMKIITVPLTFCFKSFINLAWAFFIPFKIIFDPRNKVIALNKKFLSKEIRYEQFADYVATAYGYGQYLSSIFVKSTKMTSEDGRNLYLFNFLHYVPIINLVIAYGNHIDEKCSNLLAGYPPTIQRIEGIYKALDYEIQTNKKLSPTTVERIKEEMEELKKQHEMYKKKKGARYFISRIFYKITRRSIETYKDKSSMYENVISKMDELVNEDKSELGYTSQDLQNTEIELIKLDNEAIDDKSYEELSKILSKY